MATGGVGEAMLISAITGAGTSAVMGGDPLKGALLGAATGGLGAGAAGAGTGAAGSAATNVGTNVGTQAAEQAVAQAATDQAVQQGLGQTVLLPSTMPGVPGDISALSSYTGPTAGTTTMGFSNPFYSNLASTAPTAQTAGQIATQTASSPMFPRIAEMSKSGYFYPGLGVFASFVGDRPRSNIPGAEDYSGALSRFNYDPDRYRPFRAASGGLMDTTPARRMAAGGLGSYSDGGQMLKGPGDGMSDDIPASIGDTQPARLADGEFVIPADVVSGLGNGSTEAGARELYAMMDRVREARTGRERQAPEIDAEKYLPA
jgi:hypothetical protein